MQTCGECGAELPDEAVSCDACGADLATGPAIATGADFDEESEREWFQARYGIDIGDRTVAEYLEHIQRQDYTLTTWFWIIVAAEIAVIGLIGYTVFGPGGRELLPLLVLSSVLLASSVYADTAIVGLFERWSKTRWTYIVLALVPYCGQIAAFLYLLLRRFERERTERERRRLAESGFDVELRPSRD